MEVITLLISTATKPSYKYSLLREKKRIEKNLRAHARRHVGYAKRSVCALRNKKKE